MRKVLDKNDRFGEVKLWCDARKESVVGVLVEAKSNEILFRKFFLENTTFFPTDGHPNLLEVICEVEKYNIDGLIGIIDSDFRRISNENIESDLVFMTDGHDTEMMIINSPAWENVINLYVDKKKLRAFIKTKNVKRNNNLR